MNVFDFFGTSEQERFNEIWENVIRGEPFQGQLKMHSKFQEEIWFRATFLSVNDMYGANEARERAGEALLGKHVGPVGKYFHVYLVSLDTLKVGSQHRYPVLELLHGKLPSGKFLEYFPVESYRRHYHNHILVSLSILRSLPYIFLMSVIP